MATDVEICSNALLMVGAQTINSLNASEDFSDRQRICVNLYPMVRNYVLSCHGWNCARKRVSLAAEADITGTAIVPAFDWDSQFVLPSDFLRVLSVGESGAEEDFSIESGADGARRILCNANPCLLRYIWRNTNVGQYSDLLVYAITVSMRQVISYPITQSTSLEQLIDQTLEPILKKARAIDGQDQPPEVLGDYRLLNSRFSSRLGGSSRTG